MYELCGQDADVMYGISNGVEEREEDDEALFVPLNEGERERVVTCACSAIMSPYFRPNFSSSFGLFYRSLQISQSD